MRKVRVKRKTKEVDIILEINLDGEGFHQVDTGIDFLNHMLSLFSKHAVFDLKIKAKGDLEVDIHHTNEDIGITLGEALNKGLKNKRKINRFGTAYVCMDEALVRCVLDISGRSYLKIRPNRLNVVQDKKYTFSHFKQFLKAFVDHSGITLHLDILEGEDYHHILEASFKSLGLS
ncbi:MAG TPA: imidazoleglycerol-phosphate dehydratase HisB [Candidatus Omnitrophica bacterium]|nr:imidazoleglycerol-phosphate dehydratase HisB [Candidatus Omnitrophota bacterium]